MDTIIVTGIFILILSPLFIMYLFSNRRRKKDTNEIIIKRETNKNEGFRLFGFILILMSFGVSFVPSIAGAPFWLRAIFFMFGAAFIFLPNSKINELKMFNKSSSEKDAADEAK